MKRFYSSLVAAAGLIFGVSVVSADVHPGVQGLNDLLIQKGVITKGELEAQAKKRSLNITGYIQVQGMITENNNEVDAAGNSLADEDGFRVRRAKLAASGYAYEHVKFKLEADFVGDSNKPRLDDAYIEDDRLPYLVGKAGQFKVPFSLEQLTSDTEILSIERSEVVNQITPGRDRGISFSGPLSGDMLSYSVGVFNGQTAKPRSTYVVGSYDGSALNKSNDNDQLLLGGRFVVKPEDWLHFGVNFLTSDDPDVERISYGLEFQVKNVERGCTLQGEYITQDGNGRSIDSNGFYVLGGHFIVPKRLEGVLKYEEYNTRNDLPAREDDIRWLTAGVNLYIHGNHDAKLMANYIFKGEKDDSYDNNTLLAQLQLRF